MNATSIPQADRAVPAFLIGVAGYMDLRPDETEEIRARLRTLFRFLRRGPKARDPQSPNRQTLLTTLLDDLAPGEYDAPLRRAYSRSLSAWPGLARTPIVLLCGLAPGADSLAAEIALEEEFRSDGFTVRAALPFPADLYRAASTFVREKNSAPDPANAARQAEFDRLLGAIGEEKAFPVRLARDGERALDDLREDFSADLQEPARRRERYYAAGEYLAAYCHLLIAVWNGEREPHSPAGTAAVVEARLKAQRVGVLSASDRLALPHGGPLLHLFARRPVPSDPLGANEDRPPLRWLHPYDYEREPCRVGDEPLLGESQRHNVELQRERLALFCRVAEHLETFNGATTAAADGKAELYKRLTYSQKAPDGGENKIVFAKSPPTGAEKYVAALAGLAGLRSRAVAVNRALNRRVKRTLIGIVWVTLIAAALSHVLAHWHSRKEHGDVTPAEKRRIESLHGDHPFTLPRAIIGAAPFVLAGAALVWFAFGHFGRHGDREYDSRALAEGLRVQFYWCAAGLGRSASANYMQRQRGELDWIRAAIRSVAFPYEQWIDRFAELPTSAKLAVLRCAKHAWIDEQFNFFNTKYQTHQHALHAWHTLGGVLALAGVFNGVFWWARSSSEALHLNFHPQPLPMAAFAALMLAFAWAVGWLMKNAARLWQGNASHGPAESGASHDHHQEAVWRRLVAALVPAGEHSPSASGAGSATRVAARLIAGLARFFALWPLALAIATVVASVCLAIESEAWPSPANLGIIAGGILLLAGALAVAWAEKTMLSEIAYQYNTMAALFRHASLRMERELAQLEELEREHEKFDPKLREIQEFLFELGQECLDENAEWLLLHRARPLEPVMAG